VDFVAGVGFHFFACGFRLTGGGFRGFRLLAGLVTMLPHCTRLSLGYIKEQISTLRYHSDVIESCESESIIHFPDGS